MNAFRKSYKEGFRAPTVAATIPVPLAVDNLVCFHCGRSLDEVEWLVVSTPHHKGVITFVCKEHVAHAMNFLATVFGHAKPVPDNLKMPDQSDN